MTIADLVRSTRWDFRRSSKAISADDLDGLIKRFLRLPQTRIGFGIDVRS